MTKWKKAPFQAGFNALHSWGSRRHENFCVVAYMHRAQANSNCRGAVLAAAVAKPQPMQIRVLAFHWLLVSKATEAMLTNELYGLCGRDVLLRKGSVGRKIHRHKTSIRGRSHDGHIYQMRVFYKVHTGAHEFLHMGPLNKSLSPPLSNVIGSKKLRGATACSISIRKTEEKRRGNGTRYSRSA